MSSLVSTFNKHRSTAILSATLLNCLFIVDIMYNKIYFLFSLVYVSRTISEECTVSGDPRGTPDRMNNNGGGYLNVFLGMEIQNTGWVTQFDYFAHANGNTYISFWTRVSRTPEKFTMKAKIRFQAQPPYHDYIVPHEQQVLVSAGDFVGIHYSNSDRTGKLMYERENLGEPPSEGISHDDLDTSYTGVLFDNDTNGWTEGHTITLSTEQRRFVALRIFVECGCNVDPCQRPCPPNCKDDLCNQDSAECTNGCPEGYTGPFCNNSCNSATYGENCAHYCSSNCKSGATARRCDIYDGHCHAGCVAGYTGQRCESECDSDTFGENCSNPCSMNCLSGGGQSCDIFNGNCVLGCAAGYEGDHCDSACDSDTFGENCAYHCSSNCKSDATSRRCDIYDGHCLAHCVAGYTGQHCETACNSETFGENCTNQCSANCLSGGSRNCDIFNGNCVLGCAAGYEGDHCDNECVAGTFGANCASECGNCINSVICNKVNGNCPGLCAMGYILPNCIDHCDSTHYGHNCSSVCHCRSDEACNIVNGSCPNGCAANYYGENCSIKVARETKQANTKTEDVRSGLPDAAKYVIGIIIGAASVLLGVVVVFYARRRLNTMTQKQNRNDEAQIQIPSINGGSGPTPESSVGVCITSTETSTYEVMDATNSYMDLDQNTLAEPQYSNTQPVYETITNS